VHFQLVSSYTDGTAHLRLSGELDMDAAGQFDAALMQAETYEVVVVDLRDLEFMDSTGLNLLLEADRQARARGSCRLLVVRGNPAVQRLFELTQLGDRLTFVDDPPGPKGAPGGTG